MSVGVCVSIASFDAASVKRCDAVEAMQSTRSFSCYLDVLIDVRVSLHCALEVRSMDGREPSCVRRLDVSSTCIRTSTSSKTRQHQAGVQYKQLRLPAALASVVGNMAHVNPSVRVSRYPTVRASNSSLLHKAPDTTLLAACQSTPDA